MNEGWVKLYRKFLTWEWYKDPNVKVVFLHCLLRANFKDQRYQGQMVNRGCFLTGRKEFASEIGLSVQQVRTAWNKLKSTNEITIKTTKAGSRITVCNYESYQDEIKTTNQAINQGSNQQLTNDQPTANQQLTTIKNEKKDKKEKNTTSSIDLLDSNHATKEVNEKGEKLYHGKTVDELFDWFWARYPDRGPGRNPKKKSKEIFYKLIQKKEVDPRRILIGLKVFNETVKDLEGDERRTIPMSSTWLNGEEFNDFFDRFEQSKKPLDVKNLMQEGYMTHSLAQSYAQKQYREDLEDCLTSFKIVTVDNQKLYKPLDA